MLELLQKIDESIFFFFNQTLSNPVTDFVMPYLTSPLTWIPVYILLCVYLISKKKVGLVCLVTIVVAIVIIDPLSSRFLKFEFDRIRPCRALHGVRLLVDCGVGQSFPSTHSGNSFALATVFGLFYRRWAIVGFSAATLIALSRIFVGVHYFFDILGGALLGITIGYGCYLLAQVVIKKYLTTKLVQENQ